MNWTFARVYISNSIFISTAVQKTDLWRAACAASDIGMLIGILSED